MILGPIPFTVWNREFMSSREGKRAKWAKGAKGDTRKRGHPTVPLFLLRGFGKGDTRLSLYSYCADDASYFCCILSLTTMDDLVRAIFQ